MLDRLKDLIDRPRRDTRFVYIFGPKCGGTSITAALDGCFKPWRNAQRACVLHLAETAVREATAAGREHAVGASVMSDDIVFVTRGTGFLRRAVVRELRERGRHVRVLARRRPAEWHRVPGVDYVSGDLASDFDPSWLEGVGSVLHCAAATSGGLDEHQAASIDATERVLNGMAAADCRRLVRVSSIFAF